MFRGLHRLWKRHEMKVAGVATIALYGASAAVAVKTVAKHFPAAKSADAEETSNTLGPTIQGTDFPVTVRIKRKRTSAAPPTSPVAESKGSHKGTAGKAGEEEDEESKKGGSGEA